MTWLWYLTFTCSLVLWKIREQNEASENAGQLNRGYYLSLLCSFIIIANVTWSFNQVDFFRNLANLVQAFLCNAQVCLPVTGGSERWSAATAVCTSCTSESDRWRSLCKSGAGRLRICLAEFTLAAKIHIKGINSEFYSHVTQQYFLWSHFFCNLNAVPFFKALIIFGLSWSLSQSILSHHPPLKSDAQRV